MLAALRAVQAPRVEVPAERRAARAPMAETPAALRAAPAPQAETPAGRPAPRVRAEPEAARARPERAILEAARPPGQRVARRRPRAALRGIGPRSDRTTAIHSATNPRISPFTGRAARSRP